jgi:hypothetical protein
MYEQEKLEEARYFLSRMAASTNQPKTFRYELSAFLSAARSVLQYALEEVKAKPNGQIWYDKQVSNYAVVKFFKDKRNVSIHRQPVVPETALTIKQTDVIHVSDWLSIRIISQEGNVVGEKTTAPEPAPRQEPPPPETGYRYTFTDWTGPEDGPTLCSIYLQAIEAIVNDGVAKGYLSRPS